MYSWVSMSNWTTNPSQEEMREQTLHKSISITYNSIFKAIKWQNIFHVFWPIFFSTVYTGSFWYLFLTYSIRLFYKLAKSFEHYFFFFYFDHLYIAVSLALTNLPILNASHKGIGNDGNHILNKEKNRFIFHP